MSNTPRFHGSWKGQILEAIVVEGMETWQEIQEYTKLSNAAIKQALDELIAGNFLIRTGQAKYRVIDSDIIEEYYNHYQKLAPKILKPPPPKDQQSLEPQKKPSILSRLIDFSTQKENNVSPPPEKNDLPPPPPPTVNCKTCGVANSKDRNYCGECGESLSD
ncbi:MAG: hypothetical protein FK732_11285 [Asgard group archaeon]|nr:hypothetical protein [Asgard group archaeon]